MVLPVPGGPQRMTDDSRSDSMSTRSGLPGPSRCCWPTTSSSVRGRSRAASGALRASRSSTADANRSGPRPHPPGYAPHPHQRPVTSTDCNRPSQQLAASRALRADFSRQHRVDRAPRWCARRSRDPTIACVKTSGSQPAADSAVRRSLSRDDRTRARLERQAVVLGEDLVVGPGEVGRKVFAADRHSVLLHRQRQAGSSKYVEHVAAPTRFRRDRSRCRGARAAQRMIDMCRPGPDSSRSEQSLESRSDATPRRRPSSSSSPELVARSAASCSRRVCARTRCTAMPIARTTSSSSSVAGAMDRDAAQLDATLPPDRDLVSSPPVAGSKFHSRAADGVRRDRAVDARARPRADRAPMSHSHRQAEDPWSDPPQDASFDELPRSARRRRARRHAVASSVTSAVLRREIVDSNCAERSSIARHRRSRVRHHPMAVGCESQLPMRRFRAQLLEVLRWGSWVWGFRGV